MSFVLSQFILFIYYLSYLFVCLLILFWLFFLFAFCLLSQLEAVLLEALPFSGEGPIIEVIERLMDIDENGIVDKEEFLHLLRHAEANKKVREWEA